MINLSHAIILLVCALTGIIGRYSENVVMTGRVLFNSASMGAVLGFSIYFCIISLWPDATGVAFLMAIIISSAQWGLIVPIFNVALKHVSGLIFSIIKGRSK